MKLSLLPGLDLRNTFVSILLLSFHAIKSYKHLFEVILVFSFYITFSIRPIFILKLLLRPPNVSSCFTYQLIFIKKKKTSTMSYPFQKSSVVSSCTQNKVYALQPALLTLRNLTFHSYLPLLPGRRYQMYSITSMTFCIFVSEKGPLGCILPILILFSFGCHIKFTVFQEVFQVRPLLFMEISQSLSLSLSLIISYLMYLVLIFHQRFPDT